jgi:branched-chain amino acid transport system ATP-binding protein
LVEGNFVKYDAEIQHWLGRGIRRSRREFLIQLAVVIIVLAVICIQSRTSYWQYLFSDLLLVTVVILSMDLIIAWSGIFALMSPALLVIGEYTTAIAQTHLHTDAIFPLLIGAGVSTVVAVLFALISFRIHGLLLSLITVFTAALLPTLLLALPSSLTGGAEGLEIPQGTLLGMPLTGSVLLAASAVLVLVAFALYRFVLIHGWAARFRLLARSEIGLATLGISSARTKLVVFILSAPLVGIAGGLRAYELGYLYIIDFLQDTIFMFMAVMIGGAGTVFGPFIGSGVVYGTPDFMTSIGTYSVAIFGAMLLLVVIVAPGGVASLPGAVWRTVSNARSRGMGADSPTEPPTPSPQLVTPVSSSEVPTVPSAWVRLESNPASSVGALQGINLRKTFGSVIALDECSITVRPGTIVGVVGPNGCGKSSLINALSGVYRLDSGEVLFGNRRIDQGGAAGAAAEGVRRTFQVPILPDRVRSWEAVALAVAPTWIGRRAEQTARRELEFLGVSHLADFRMEKIPHGDRRLVNIAQVLAAEPHYVLLDEPLSGLTAEEADRLALVLRDVANRGIGVLVVEHQLDWMLGLADTVAVMERGVVVDQGSSTEVVESMNRVVRAGSRSARSEQRQTGKYVRQDNSITALDVQDLTVSYGGAPVVKRASLRVVPGETVAIIGPNGAGKSSFMRAIAGAVAADSGSVILDSHDISKASIHTRARRGLILAAEGRPLFRSLTVRENLEVGAALGQRSRKKDYEGVLEAFDALRKDMDRPAASLSGGQQQMLVIAQALLCSPHVLLLDEPTLGLAEKVASDLLQRLHLAIPPEVAVIVSGEWDKVGLGVDAVYTMENGNLTRRKGAGSETYDEEP